MALISFYGQLFLKIQQRIKDKVPEIRYCEQDLGQLEMPDQMGRYPVSFPCLLIDFVDTAYDQMQNNRQWGTPVLHTRLGFAPFSSSNSLAPQEVREKALTYFELENKVYAAFQGWDADGLCQPFTRIKDGTEQREDTIRVRIGIYNSAFEDDTATPEMQAVERPTLEMEFEPNFPEP